MTVARALEKEDWRKAVTKDGHRCEGLCPICKQSCMGHSGHIYSSDTADVGAHQCGKHWWLIVFTPNGNIQLSGRLR